MNKRYQQAIWTTGGSALAGFSKEWTRIELDQLVDTPLMRAFLGDDDIQEISIASGNLGIARTYQKRYAK